MASTRHERWKRGRIQRFDNQTVPRIKRWRRSVLPVLYDLGGDILKNFDRRYGRGKSAVLYRDHEWLLELRDFRPNSGGAYLWDGELSDEHWRSGLSAKADGDTLLGKPVGTAILFDPEEWGAKFAAAAQPLAQEALRNAAQTITAEIGRGTFDPTSPTVRRALGQRVRQYSKFVVEGTDKIVQTQIRAGYRSGESIAEIRDRIVARMHPKDFEVTGRFTSLHQRAEGIARTETVGAHNLGNYTGIAEAGAKTRIWITMGDDRVRDSHAMLDGEERDIDKPWVVDGREMMYPMDYNERCTEGPGRLGRAT